MTEKDGLLPISNFTKEVSVKKAAKKGEAAAVESTQIFGKVQSFVDEETEVDPQ